MAPFCSLTDFYCANIQRHFFLFLLQVLSWKLFVAFSKVKLCFVFSYQEIYFVQWSFGIRLCSSKWSFSRLLTFFPLTNHDVFEHILFFRDFPFRDFGTVPSYKARTDCFSSLCSFSLNRDVLWCFLGTKWSFIAKRATNCSKLRICSETNWSLIDGLGTAVPKNVFLLITRERVFIKKNKEQNGPLVLKWNQLFRVQNSEPNNLVLYAWFESCCS